MKKNNKIRAGFTLAEVLITLGIVGVIAAMTIPTLMNKTNDKETVVRLKKAYSALLSATESIIAEEGPISSWNWNESGYSMDEIIANYKKQLTFSKSCTLNVNTCYDASIWKLLNGNAWTTMSYVGNGYHNILQDGTFIKFQKCPTTTCEYSQIVSTNVTAKMEIWVDLNGNKSPNILGRDIFLFILTPEKGVIPPDYGVSSRCAANQTGLTCSTKIIQEDGITY